MTKYSYYLLLSCLMFLAGCQTVEPLAIDYMLPADVSFPPSLKRVAIVNNMPEVPDNKPILAKEKKKDDFEIASKTDYYNGNAAIATESLAEALAHENYFNADEVVQQEIALYKVTRSRNVEKLVREHNVRILEIDDDYIVVEKTGHKAETQALFRLLQPFGVQQFVRSGTVAIIKSRRELLNEYLEELERNRQRTDSF